MSAAAGIDPSDPLTRPAIPRPLMRERCADEDVAPVLRKLVAARNGCWAATNRRQRDGYVMMRPSGSAGKRMAHIVVWEKLVGPIPAGLHLDHLCRNRACVNPEHLEPVTPSENIRRSLNGVRQTVCREGHEIAGENAYVVRTTGNYRCKKCYFADNKRRQKIRVTCVDCGRGLTAGSVGRHLRENCPGVTEQAA